MKASIGSKFKVPSVLFVVIMQHGKWMDDIREIVEGFVHARDIENLPFLGPHPPHFPFRDCPASGFVRIPDFPTRFSGIAHASLVSPTVRILEGAEQGSVEPVRGSTEGGQQGRRRSEGSKKGMKSEEKMECLGAVQQGEGRDRRDRGREKGGKDLVGRFK